MKALLQAQLLPAWVRHFNLELYDIIYDLSKKVYGSGEHVLPGHRRTEQQPLALRHGFHFALEHQRKLLQRQQQQQPRADAAQGQDMPAAAAAATLLRNRTERKTSSSVHWVTARLGMPHLHPQRSIGAVQQVLSGSNSTESLMML